MRPIEFLLSGANLLALFSLVISLPPALHGFRYAAPIALVIAIAQIVFEGPRWQMIPAYGLAIIFVLIWLLPTVVPNDLLINRFFVGLGIISGVLGMLVSLLLPIVLPVFHFPKPTGPYSMVKLHNSRRIEMT